MKLTEFSITIYLDEAQLKQLDAYIETRVERKDSRWTRESALAVLAAVGLQVRTEEQSHYRKVEREKGGEADVPS